VQTQHELMLDGAGWQNHPVCTRKYHFIIPVRASQDTALAHGNIPALVEIWLQGSSKKPLLLPQYLSDDVGTPFVAPISIFDSTSHVLHGVLHANGFGHLVRINGLEGGSEHVTGGHPLHLSHACHGHDLDRSPALVLAAWWQGSCQRGTSPLDCRPCVLSCLKQC
jgi:hypothetical protein